MAKAICSYCDKPVILIPSAAERAKRYGGKPSDYTALFPNHSACSIAAREADTLDLIRRRNAERAATRVTYPLTEA